MQALKDALEARSRLPDMRATVPYCRQPVIAAPDFAAGEESREVHVQRQAKSSLALPSMSTHHAECVILDWWNGMSCADPPSTCCPLPVCLQNEVYRTLISLQNSNLNYYTTNAHSAPQRASESALSAAREREAREPGLAYLLVELVPDSAGEPWGTADDAADHIGAAVPVVPFTPCNPEEHAEQVHHCSAASPCR